MALAQLLSEQLLLDLAGPASYERGLGYHARDLVASLEVISDHSVRAVVAGTERYITQLRASGSRVTAACTCPVGMSGAFCKHAVAVGLALLVEEGTEVAPSATSECRPRRATRGRSSSATPRRPATGVASVKAQLQFTMRLSGYLDWRQTTRWADRALEAIDAVDSLVATDPDAAITLCEYALKRCDAAYGRVDDSGGELSMLMARAEAIHLEACTAAQPDPIALARRLYKVETTAGLDLFADAYERYAAVLGETGAAEYRRLADAEWLDVDGRSTPRSTGPMHDFDHVERVRRVAAILELIARADRDIDRLVEVVGRELDSGYAHARLARALVDVDALDDALAWIARGLERHTGERQVHDAAIDVHLARGEHDMAIEHAWTLYVPTSSLTDFQRLLRCTSSESQRVELRDRALDHARDVAEARNRSTELVELLVSENLAREALEAARTWPCWPQTALRAAQANETTDPEAAASVYMTLAMRGVTDATRRSYERAAQLLARADALLASEEGRNAFEAAIEEIRTNHERKRSLLAMLEKRGW